METDSTLCPKPRLKLLYLSPNLTHENAKEAIAMHGHDIVYAATCADALHLILECRFDAVVIQDEDENQNVIDFTIEVNRIMPKLPVFFTSDWESDLPIALDNIITGAFDTGDSGQFAWRGSRWFSAQSNELAGWCRATFWEMCESCHRMVIGAAGLRSELN